MARPSGSLVALLVLPFVLLVACSDGDEGDAVGAGGQDEAGAETRARFCDVFLDYLADSSPQNLEVVADSTDDPDVGAHVDTIRTSGDLTEVLAATLDLDELARTRCQPEWTAGAQGAGNTPAAAQAFLDALVAGDPVGARNVASANAIAVFEPWDPIPSDPAAGTPAIDAVGDEAFSLVLTPDRVAQCQVETGVVITCTIV